MKLTQLSIRRLPGIHTPFGLGPEQLADGVHVVHGPNSSGKSSLCRALAALLWPERIEGFGVHVEARFEHSGSTWIAQREGREVRWRKDGVPSAPPELPDAHLAHCYVIGNDDLNEDLEGEKPGAQDGTWFAARVWTAMAGGYDMRALRIAHFTLGQKHGVRQEEAWRGACGDLRTAELEQEQILRETAELDELAGQLDAARAAQRELEGLGAARDLGAARSKLAGLARELEAFPTGMAAVRGDEGERLETLEDERAALESSRAQLAAAREDQRRALERARLATPIAPESFNEQRRRLADLRDQESRLARLESELAGARRRRGEAGADGGTGSAPSAAQFETLEDLARQSERLASERAALAVRLSTLAALPVGADGETLARAARALRAWLAAPQAAPDGPWIWVLAVTSAAAAVVLATQVHSAWFALCLPALFPLVRAVGGRGRAARAGAGRADLRSEYERTQLAPPSAWEPGAVERRLHELDGETATLRFAEREAGSRREAEALEQSLEQRERELADRRAALGRELGADADLSVLGLVDLAAKLRNRHVAADEERGAQAERETLQAARDGAAAALAAWLVEHGERPGADAPALERALDTLLARSNSARDVLRTTADLERQRAESAQSIERLDAQRARIFATLGLPPDGRAGLDARLEGWGRWKRIHADHEHQRERVNELQAQIQAAPELAEVAADEIDRRLETARRQVDGREDLVRSHSAIFTRAKEAGRRSTLEDARAAEQSARGDLLEELDTALSALAGQLLVEEVEREHSVASRPAVLERARRLFAAFTAQRYSLDVTQIDGRVHLRAQDASDPERGLGPEELSGGTRAQLLLAARLAFAAENERGACLPMFLDDALATSDPERVSAIARSLFALAASEGRQVFVLTPDASDVALLRAVGSPLAVIDLAALRGQQIAVVQRERLALPEQREIPEVAGRTPQDYARELNVPALDPWRSAADAHLYYLLVDDLALLRKLLAWHTERLWALRATVAAGGAGFLAADELARVELWARVLESTRASWLVGRGLPIDRGALEAAGVSDNYLDKLADLAVELGGDTKRLLAKIEARDDERAKGFRANVLERVRANLETSGHLDSQDPLDVEEAWRRLLRDLDELPAGQRPAPEPLRQRFEFLRARFDEAAAR